MSSPARRALVVQGGGMRGAYAAGAATALLWEERERFDAVWATSSGAATCAYGVAGQIEGLDIWKDHLHGRRLVSLPRVLRGGVLLDLDYLIDEVFRRRIPLDVGRLRAAGVPVNVPLTDIADGSVRYFDLATRDPFPILRGAMSLPGAVRTAVEIDGRRYVDGGVVDQVPVRQALRAGATDLVVILTRSASHVVRPTGAVSRWLATRPFPGLASALRERHRAYAEELRLLASPPPGVRVRVIRPPDSMRLSRWTTRRDRLLAAIQHGLDDARRRAGNGAGAPPRMDYA